MLQIVVFSINGAKIWTIISRIIMAMGMLKYIGNRALLVSTAKTRDKGGQKDEKQEQMSWWVLWMHFVYFHFLRRAKADKY